MATWSTAAVTCPPQYACLSSKQMCYCSSWALGAGLPQGLQVEVSSGLHE